MHLAVLTTPDSWYFRDLCRAAGSEDSVRAVSFQELAARVATAEGANGAAQLPLSDCDAVLVRSMPPGSLEQVVFRMDVLGQLDAAGTAVVNSPRSLETAIDKYLTLARLAAAGLDVPPTAVCQTVEQAMEAFERLGGDVVVKPLFGGEGRGIVRASDPDLALRAFKLLASLNAVLYVQQFVEHEGGDLRLFVLPDRVLGIRRHNPSDWRSNVSRGARTERLEVDSALAERARSAAAAVGALIAGVDLLVARDGRPYVLEVNAVPGWKALARTLELDVARVVLETVAAHVACRT